MSIFEEDEELEEEAMDIKIAGKKAQNLWRDLSNVQSWVVEQET